MCADNVGLLALSISCKFTCENKKPESLATVAALLGNVSFLVRLTLFIAVSILCYLLPRATGTVLVE